MLDCDFWIKFSHIINWYMKSFILVLICAVVNLVAKILYKTGYLNTTRWHERVQRSSHPHPQIYCDSCCLSRSSQITNWTEKFTQRERHRADRLTLTVFLLWIPETERCKWLTNTNLHHANIMNSQDAYTLGLGMMHCMNGT